MGTLLRLYFGGSIVFVLWWVMFYELPQIAKDKKVNRAVRGCVLMVLAFFFWLPFLLVCFGIALYRIWKGRHGNG